LAIVHVGIIALSIRFQFNLNACLPSLFNSSLRKHVLLKGPEEARRYVESPSREYCILYWKIRFPAVLDVIIWLDSTQRRVGGG
jgi:hypothetical protein